MNRKIKSLFASLFICALLLAMYGSVFHNFTPYQWYEDMSFKLAFIPTVIAVIFVFLLFYKQEQKKSPRYRYSVKWYGLMSSTSIIISLFVWGIFYQAIGYGVGHIVTEASEEEVAIQSYSMYVEYFGVYGEEGDICDYRLVFIEEPDYLIKNARFCIDNVKYHELYRYENINEVVPVIIFSKASNFGVKITDWQVEGGI